MKHRIGISIVLLLLAGCATVHYMGESYPPTQHADLFFSEADIQKEYKVIGRMEATANADELVYSSEKFTDEILKKACEKGADAVVILDFKNVITKVDLSEKSLEEKRRVEALIIKYLEPQE